MRVRELVRAAGAVVIAEIAIFVVSFGAALLGIKAVERWRQR